MNQFRVISNTIFTLTLLSLIFSHFVTFPTSPHRRSLRETTTLKNNNISSNNISCNGIIDHIGYETSCEFLKNNAHCSSDSFFDYVKFYYCDSNETALGSVVLVLWLVALFYLLGNTAADYFCLSLRKMSALLGLSPAVAGVSLLPLGNGAPDVFASVVSFVGKGNGEVGLNSVLGGAVFVTCVVVGVVAICVGGQGVRIDKKAFLRDVGFFMFTLVFLFFILVVGRVSVVVAVMFVCIYVVYAVFVAANEIVKKHVHRLKLDVVTPLIPLRVNIFSQEEDSVQTSLLDVETEDDGLRNSNALPEWMWASNVAIYSNQMKLQEHERHLWGWQDDGIEVDQPWFSFWKLCSLLEFPLTVPRRLTIPSVEEETWSKPYAVASASLSPLLLAFIWNTQDDLSSLTRKLVYLLGAVVGFTLGTLAYTYTRSDHPPRRYLFPWVLGGFLMSIVWFYMIANELVALLVGFGMFLRVNPSILGLTVLAWGNSMGDLVSNIALALDGGDGIQIALSGCYAGPMFNTLVGLGISLLIGSWSEKPESYTVPQDNSLYYTMGFLILGLVWALVILLKNDMRVNRMLGIGLVALYLVFLSVRLAGATGILPLAGLSKS